MYLDRSSVLRNGKKYTRVLLRNSYRKNGKVKHDTIANLSSCSKEVIEALRLALKHKDRLSNIETIGNCEAQLGKRIGAVWAVHQIMRRIGIVDALGDQDDAKLALFQIMARVIDQGSRLSAVRFAASHLACEILGIPKLNEDDLYRNLAWLSTNQETIEKRLFERRCKSGVPTLFLYDVTSSYLEGTENAFAAFGYNRDGKKNKMQIVVGLLSGPDGLPVAVRVFKGNTNDTKTVSDQIKILAEKFSVKEVTLVGDRGMLRGPQIDLLPEDFRYVTAITKPQVRKMLGEGTLQIELFNEKVTETVFDGVRYVMRRNPVRAAQIAATRQDKEKSIRAVADARNRSLKDHPRSTEKAALRGVQNKIAQLGTEAWMSATIQGRVISLELNDGARSNAALLDGCYVIKSDVPASSADAQTLHDRYCDLEMVERTFRTMKRTHLDLRPVYVRKCESTQGHVFVVMLALLVQRELEKHWRELDTTVFEGLEELGSISTQVITINKHEISNIPNPPTRAQNLLSQISVILPPAYPYKNADVYTKKKLQHERAPL